MQKNRNAITYSYYYKSGHNLLIKRNCCLSEAIKLLVTVSGNKKQSGKIGFLNIADNLSNLM